MREGNTPMQRSIPILWGLVIALLVLNLALLYAFNQARLIAIETLGEAETTLDSLANEVIVYNIEVNQAVPMKADVPLDRTMEIPLKTVIPIDQVLTVPFQTPTGEVVLAVPVKTDFPIDIVVPVDFNQTINVDTEIQLMTTFPVEIDIAQTTFAGYLKQAQSDIAYLRNRLALQGRGAVMDEMVAAATSDVERSVDSASTSTGDSPSQAVSVEATVTEVAPKSDTLHVSQASALNPASSPGNLAAQPDLGLCAHTYWPLRSGTAWTYNSPDTSYTLRVDGVSNNQVLLSTQYEGRDIQFSLACSLEGLGADYLGDMRRITELGELSFSNPRGTFLPSPERMEEIGRSWTQDLDVTGTVKASQGNTLVTGKISRGRAAAVYTPTSFESVETPLGPREALRIEQKLELELNIDFALPGQTIPAHEVVNLTTVYWFVKGIGPVKTHWQGGTIQQDAKLEQTPINQQSLVPALAEDQLVFVCVLSEGGSSECMRIAGMSQSDLTVPPESELEVQSFVFPSVPDGEEPGTEQPPEEPGTEQPPEEPGTEQPPEDPTEDDNGHAALLAYAAEVEKLGKQLYDAAQHFWEAALKFRSGELTFDEFRDEFSAFSPKVESLVDGINRLSPPPKAQAVHQKLTGGLAKCDQAVDLMGDWFDTPNSDTKEAATLLVTQCTGEIADAQEELEALINEN
jgi:hypothetical protein